MTNRSEKRRPNLLPIAIAALCFVAGFILLVPMGCTMKEVSVDGDSNAVTPSSGETTCSNVMGVDYRGEGNYNPPLWPAGLAGLAAAVVGGGSTMLLQLSRTPRPLSARALARIGLAAHTLWVSFLSSLGLFSSGSLDPQWRTALVFVSLAAFPGALAALGLRNRPGLLLAAGILCVPLSFMSLAGATLPLLLPAALYLVSYSRTPVTEPRERSPWTVPPPTE